METRQRPSVLGVLVRAAALDGPVYGEALAAPGAIVYALPAVGAAAGAFGVGAWAAVSRRLDVTPLSVMPVAAVTVVVGWVVWSLVGFAGARLTLRGRGTYRKALRATGIAYAPGIFMVLTAVPALGTLFFSFASVWVLAAAVVATREVHGLGWVWATLIAFVGWLPVVVSMAMLLRV